VPHGARERVVAPLLRLALRLALKPMLSPDVPIAHQRRRAERLARLARPRIAVAIEPAVMGGVPGEWLRPADAAANAAILYLHGGGYCIGSPSTHRAITMHLADAARLPVFAADYRLAPEHPYPAAIEDAQRHRLADVALGDCLGAVQIGDRPRDATGHAAVRPRRDAGRPPRRVQGDRQAVPAL